MAGGPSVPRWHFHLHVWLLGGNGGRTESDGIVLQSIYLWPIQHNSLRTVVLTGWFRAPRARVFLETKEEAARLYMTTSEVI